MTHAAAAWLFMAAACAGAGFVGAAPAPPASVLAGCTNATDCTAELQAALDTCARTVQVPTLPGGRSWVVRTITVRCSGQTIDLDPGVVRGRPPAHARGRPTTRPRLCRSPALGCWVGSG